MPEYNHTLVYDAERLSNGANVHKLKNMVMAYQSCYQFYLDCGSMDAEALFREAETALQKIINHLRFEKDTDELNIT